MIFVTTLAGLMLAGCVTKASVARDIQSRFVGKPLSAATTILGAGQPADGGYVWQKRLTQDLFVPTITAAGGKGSNPGTTTVGHTTEQAIHYCTLTLTVDAAGIITAATTQGDRLACGQFIRQ